MAQQLLALPLNTSEPRQDMHQPTIRPRQQHMWRQIIHQAVRVLAEESVMARVVHQDAEVVQPSTTASPNPQVSRSLNQLSGHPNRRTTRQWMLRRRSTSMRFRRQVRQSSSPARTAGRRSPLSGAVTRADIRSATHVVRTFP